MRLHGIWLYGALSLTTLAIAGFFYDQKLTVILSIMAMGFAYAAEFVAQEEEWGRHWAPAHTQITLVLASVTSGLVAFSTLIINQ
jgi:hypothetical protein